MIYLRSFDVTEGGENYPFGLPALSGMKTRAFSAPITLFAGENGSGKSTLLEALARRIVMPALGQYDTAEDHTLNAVQPLSNAMKLIWSRKPKRKFFLRSEDFFGFVKRMSTLHAELMSDMRAMEPEYEERSQYAKDQVRMPYLSSMFEIEHRYGADPDAQSHGESFLSVFESRMQPGGLYLMDEPEGALSPVRQMALLRMIHERSDSCQFIIATHSPILLALPNADILSFDEHPATSVPYGDLQQVQILRGFLSAPERYVAELLS